MLSTSTPDLHPDCLPRYLGWLLMVHDHDLAAGARYQERATPPRYSAGTAKSYSFRSTIADLTPGMLLKYVWR
jgi:hypothetical protein